MRLGDGRSDRHPRIERAVGVLEDDLHPAAHLAQGVGLQAHQVDAVERHLAVRGLAEPDQRAAGGALAAAGLADEAQRLAAADRERDAVDRLHRPDRLLEHAGADREVDLEVLDLDEVVRRCRAGLGRAGQRRGHAIHPSGWVAQQRARWPFDARSVSIGSCSLQMSRT